ncbi:hypothetical protein [Campylobacter gastrosuis]|uniref:Methionyl aminopeptidase n=1 Tax=Campylobacter gastrosuis TaxID=2974576 RepID=A0ABT7HSB7_9BACT|nr:hypothetical protein [Campylobacter gastrosuis]MDL0089585.1 hypothetical protein [Campylobacter gastrosuis]
MAITLKRPQEIQKLREANIIVAKTLDYVQSVIKPVMNLLEIDKICEEMILSKIKIQQKMHQKFSSRNFSLAL